MTDIDLLTSLIPDRNGFRFTGLPEDPTLKPDKLFTWDVTNPDVITSTHTGTTYPNSDHPEDKVLTVLGRNGDQLEYPYHEDEEGRRYLFTAHMWYLRKNWLRAQMTALAETDQLGAGRMALRFMQVFSTWLTSNEQVWLNRPVPIETSPPNYYWGGAFWGWWWVSDMIGLRSLVTTIARIKSSGKLDVVNAQLGVDLRAELRAVAGPTLEHYNTYPKDYGNQAPLTGVGKADLARLLNEPSLMHEVVEWAVDYSQSTFLFDGMYLETSVHYHGEAAAGLSSVANGVRGWSDPVGYESPLNGDRFEDLDLANDLPLLGASLALTRQMVYPDGKHFPIDDTWAAVRPSNPDRISEPRLWPAAGVGRLVGGTANDLSHTYLLWSPKYGGHFHRAALPLALHDRGRELLPDFGYTHSRLATWAKSALGHNTVVIDSSDMATGGAAADGGDLQLHEPGAEVSVMAADDNHAYAQTDVYRREAWVIHPADRDSGYVVDLITVAGGSRHELTYQGDTNHDAVATTSHDLTEYGERLLPSGVVVTEPTSETDRGDAEGHYYAYMHVKNVSSAEITDGAWDVAFDSTDEEPIDTKFFGLVSPGDATLFVGECPALRSTRTLGIPGDTNDQVEGSTAPKLVLRRDGSDLATRFATVIQSASGGPGTIASTSWSDEAMDPDSYVLTIEGDGFTDHLISLPSQQTLTVGPAEFSGSRCWLRIQSGEITAVDIIGEGHLVAPGVEVTSSPDFVCEVSDVLRRAAGDDVDGLVLTEAPHESLSGRTAIVTRPDGSTHGYPIIENIAVDDVPIAVVADCDPGFVVNGDGSSAMVFTPFTSWAGGAHEFRIRSRQSWRK